LETSKFLALVEANVSLRMKLLFAILHQLLQSEKINIYAKNNCPKFWKAKGYFKRPAFQILPKAKYFTFFVQHNLAFFLHKIQMVHE
jgi:hypothetical protein